MDACRDERIDGAGADPTAVDPAYDATESRDPTRLLRGSGQRGRPSRPDRAGRVVAWDATEAWHRRRWLARDEKVGGADAHTARTPMRCHRGIRVSSPDGATRQRKTRCRDPFRSRGRSMAVSPSGPSLTCTVMFTTMYTDLSILTPTEDRKMSEPSRRPLRLMRDDLVSRGMRSGSFSRYRKLIGLTTTWRRGFVRRATERRSQPA